VLESVLVKMLALVGIFFPGVNPDIAMGRPVVELHGSRITISCRLERPLSDDLLNVIESGTPVRLSFVCRLRTDDGRTTQVPDTIVTHEAVKDLVAETYEITLGERTLKETRLREYSQLFRLETVPLWEASAVDSQGKYAVEVSARLEPIYIHATGQTYDLMALWNYRSPGNRSEVFTLDGLQGGQVAQ